VSAEPWLPASTKAWRIENVEAGKHGGARLTLMRDDGLRVAVYSERCDVLTPVGRER
jgi:hypothetical protein